MSGSSTGSIRVGNRPRRFWRIAATLWFILAMSVVAAASASADGTIVAMKGGDRSASNSVSGATNYATGVSGATFEYTTGNPTQPATIWTAFSSATGAAGTASAVVPAGTYYVREKAPGSGFTNYGPVTSLSFSGAQPYVARVTVSNNQTTYAFPHSNTAADPASWTPTQTANGTNNGSPFINVRDNGVVPPGCGTNILLVLDRSGSIEPYKNDYEAAAKQFVSSLNGTPTQIGIVSFNSSVNSYQPATGNASFYQSPLSLASAGSAATLNGKIENIYDDPDDLTNWDGVLQAAAQAKSFSADATTGQTTNPDMVVFITDGNPTTSQASTSNSNEDLINLTSGMASANLVKNQTARPGGKVKLLAIGVGTGVTIDNLKAVSGPMEGVDGDYAAPTIPELSAFLSELAASQCGARVYVRKLVTGQAGNQANWLYTATDPRPGKTPTYQDGNRATHSSGNPPVIETGAFFSQLPSTPTTVNINEDAAGQPMTNFELTSVDCRKGSYGGTAFPGGVKNGLQFSLPVNRGDTAYCTYTNTPKTTLSVAKTPDNQLVNAGEDVEFAMTVTNTGTNPASGVTLTDVLPTPGVGGWTISQQPGGNPCSITAGTLNCAFGNLAQAATATVKVKTGTSFALCAVYDNTAQASATNANQVTDSGKVTCRKPALSITKTGNGPITAGQDASFTITVANAGPGTAKSVTLSDPLPGGTAGPWVIGSQPAGNPCSIVGGSMSCNFGDIAAGQQVQVTVKAPTNNTACTTYNNLATAGASNSPSVEGNASITCNKPNLGTLKTAVQATISAGDKAQFEITVSNAGPGTATGVTLSDPLPTGVSGSWSIVSQPAGNPCSIAGGTLNCNFGDMAAGTSKVVKVEAATDFQNCTQLVNLATASASNAPNAADDATIQCQKPNLSVVKQGNGPVNAGEKVTFKITVSNAGPGIARAVKLGDPLPAGTAGTWSIATQPAGNPCSITAGTLNCDFGDLTAGQSRVIDIEANTNTANCTQYDNTATATSTNAPNAVGQASVICRKPNLDVQKSGNGTVNAGEDVKFTVTVSNSGPGTAKAVTVSDPLPAGTAGAWTIQTQPAGNPCSITVGTLNCAFGDVAAGGSAAVTVVATTDADHCAKYDNTVTATSTNAPQDTASASDQCLKPSLTLTKTGNGPINAGDNVVYGLKIENGGPGVAKSVKLSDPLPTGVAGTWSITNQPAGNPCAIVAGQLVCDFGDLAAGASRSVTISAATDFEHCQKYDNLATGTAVNHASVNAQASVDCLKPSLNVVKTGNGPINAGEDAEFGITVSNNGPGEAKAVKLHDPLPTGVAGAWTISSQPGSNPCAIVADVLDCNFGNMASGASAVVKVKAPTSHDACKLFENKATASGDGIPGIDASASVSCLKPALGTLKTAVQGTISAGDAAQFEITVSNTGAGTAKDVKLSDPLPSGVTGSWSILSQPAGDPCSITAGTLNCDFGDLAPGASANVKVEAQTDFESCSQLVNLATASASNAPNASDDATINCQKPSLTLTKVGNGTVNAGEDVTFTMDLKNEGPGVARATKLSDPLPSGVAGNWSITVQPLGDPCSITAGTLNCDFGDLAAGQERTVTVKTATDFDHCAKYDNTATGTASNHPNVTGSDSVTCLKPNVGLLKTAVQGTISAGDDAQFSITVSNTGQGVAHNVTLNDPLPVAAGAWSIVSQPQGNPCSIQGDQLNCSFGDLQPGASVVVKVKASTDFEQCAELKNVATATAGNSPSATGQATIDCQKPDLTISKNGNGPIDAGEDILFRVEVSNAGPGVAKAVVLTDALPSGTAAPWLVVSTTQGTCSIAAGVLSCAFGDVPSGVTASVIVTAPTDAANCGTYDNTATFTAANAPSGTDTASVECLMPKLKLVKTGNGPVDAGEKVKFTITVTNDGPGKATGVKVKDPLPAGAAGGWKVEDETDGTDCSIADLTMDCDVGDLEAGESASVRVAAPTSDVKCTTYENVAQESAKNAPPLTATATVGCRKSDPKLQLKKSANRKKVFPGDIVRYEIRVRNIQKGTVAKDLKVCDRLPAQMTVASRGEDSFFEDGKLCWRIERLPYSLKWRVFSYTARVDDNVGAGTRLKNVVTLGNLKATKTIVVKQPPVSPARRRTPVTG